MDYTERLDEGQPPHDDERLYYDVATRTYSWNIIRAKPDAATQQQAQAILRAIMRVDLDSIPF